MVADEAKTASDITKEKGFKYRSAAKISMPGGILLVVLFVAVDLFTEPGFGLLSVLGLISGGAMIASGYVAKRDGPKWLYYALLGLVTIIVVALKLRRIFE